MEPKNLYIAIVSTLGIFIIVGFFCAWWYDKYNQLKQYQNDSMVYDVEFFMHNTNLIAVLCAAVGGIFAVWMMLS